MSTGLLYNYGASSRSTVRVAAGVEPMRLELFSTAVWLPRPERPFLEGLCEALGIDGGNNPELALYLAAEAALERAAAPAAAVAHPPVRDVPGNPASGGLVGPDPAGPPPEPVIDRALVLAVLSRSSGSLFLRARSPRMDAASLGAARAFVVGTFVRTL